MVRLRPTFVGPDCAEMLIKLEYLSPTGSYKDRMALAMIEEAEARGDLQPGMTVLEYTGGSTGSSLAFVCAVKGYRFKVVSSDAFAQEKLQTMPAFGADLVMVPSQDGRITPDLIPRMIEEAGKLSMEPGVYWTNQLHNRDSIVGYRRIGEEIVRQVDTSIDVFCAGVGTAGMLTGVAQALRAAGWSSRIVALEPANSPVISTGLPGTHHVEGIGIGFAPPLLTQEDYDKVRTVDEEPAREVARRLARDEGTFSGTSTGLNTRAALDIARELGPDKTVMTVAVDSGLKYLSGNLYKG